VEGVAKPGPSEDGASIASAAVAPTVSPHDHARPFRRATAMDQDAPCVRNALSHWIELTRDL
jgi:hypothetical protein